MLYYTLRAVFSKPRLLKFLRPDLKILLKRCRRRDLAIDASTVEPYKRDGGACVAYVNDGVARESVAKLV